MANSKKYYMTAWGIAVVVFHVIMFLLPNAGFELGKGTFWVIYLSIMISLIGQGACSFYYAGKQKKEERFLYVPVVLISYIALLMNLLLALEAVTLSFLPTWFTVIVALLVWAFYALAVIRTIAAADMVVEIDKKVEQQTGYMRALTARAKALEQGAPVTVKKQVSRVYESLRYSDPMSSPQLAELEVKIQTAYENFVNVVQNADEKAAEKQADNLCNMVKERNELCKIYKR